MRLKGTRAAKNKPLVLRVLFEVVDYDSEGSLRFLLVVAVCFLVLFYSVAGEAVIEIFFAISVNFISLARKLAMAFSSFSRNWRIFLAGFLDFWAAAKAFRVRVMPGKVLWSGERVGSCAGEIGWILPERGLRCAASLREFSIWRRMSGGAV